MGSWLAPWELFPLLKGRSFCLSSTQTGLVDKNEMLEEGNHFHKSQVSQSQNPSISDLSEN